LLLTVAWARRIIPVVDDYELIAEKLSELSQQVSSLENECPTS